MKSIADIIQEIEAMDFITVAQHREITELAKMFDIPLRVNGKTQEVPLTANHAAQTLNLGNLKFLIAMVHNLNLEGT